METFDEYCEDNFRLDSDGMVKAVRSECFNGNDKLTSISYTELERMWDHLVKEMMCCGTCKWGSGHSCKYPDAMYTTTFGHPCDKWHFEQPKGGIREMKLKE